MKILRGVNEVREWRRGQAEVAFVPTMGALHQGHATLVRAAQRDNTAVLVSIFVNPTQFNDPEDLKKYPRTEAADLNLLSELKADAVFIPAAEEIYADGFNFIIDESVDSAELCGRFRPGHFRGMLTVVLKLFNIVTPTRAYFGEKDFQQLTLVRRMVEAFHLPVAIVGVPTVREADGLAMSSRNVRLSPSDRERAPRLYKILSTAPSAPAAVRELNDCGFQVEYVEDRWNRRLAAVQLNGVRLIDNVAL